MLRTESATLVLLPIAISSSLIFATELPDDGGYIKGASVIVVRPLIIMLPLMNCCAQQTGIHILVVEALLIL